MTQRFDTVHTVVVGIAITTLLFFCLFFLSMQSCIFWSYVQIFASLAALFKWQRTSLSRSRWCRLCSHPIHPVHETQLNIFTSCKPNENITNHSNKNFPKLEFVERGCLAWRHEATAVTSPEWSSHESQQEDAVFDVFRGMLGRWNAN